MADFPQESLQPVKASTDIDLEGVGIYTLVKAMTCPCCEHGVEHCRASSQPNGDFILTCPTCLHPLGLLEEN